MAFKPRVYLAGPVADVEDGGHEWRDYITETFESRFDWLNPLDKYDVPAGDVVIVDEGPTGDGEITATELVTADREMVREADAVLVGWERAVSVGTPMEVMLAHESGTPIAVWDADHEAHSPWWTYHADLISPSLTSCLDFLEDELQAVETDGRGELHEPVHKTLFEAVGRHGDETVNGARVGTVIDDVLEETEVGLHRVSEELGRLLRNGELYQPSDKTLARVSPGADGGDA